MIDMRYPLAVLTTRMPWGQIEESLAPLFAHRSREGRAVTDTDLFGATSELVGDGVSNAWRPRLPIRLMVALIYVKHAYNESDESVVQRWAQDVYFQFFSGQVYFQPRLPCDDSQIGRFRQDLGKAGVEQLLKTTIEAAVEMKVVKRTELERVIVDTTVQEKAVAHPSDSRLLEVVRARIAQLATRAGISMRQTCAAEGQQLRRRAGGYAHAKQFKRLRCVLRRQHVILGRLLRDIECKMANASQAGLKNWIERAWRIQRQLPHDSKKLYALHAPEARGGPQDPLAAAGHCPWRYCRAFVRLRGVAYGGRPMPGDHASHREPPTRDPSNLTAITKDLLEMNFASPTQESEPRGPQATQATQCKRIHPRAPVG